MNMSEVTQFYILKSETVSNYLIWSNYCEFFKVNDELQRSFYEY